VKYLGSTTHEGRSRNLGADIFAWMMSSEKVKDKAPTQDAVHEVVKALTLAVTERAWTGQGGGDAHKDPASDPSLPPEAYYGMLGVWIDTHKPPGTNTHTTNKDLVALALGGEKSEYAKQLDGALMLGKVMSESRPTNKDDTVLAKVALPTDAVVHNSYEKQLGELRAMILEMQQGMVDSFRYRERSEARIKDLEREVLTVHNDPLGLDKVARAVQGLEPHNGVMTDSDDETKCKASMDRRLKKIHSHTVEESEKWYYPEYAMEMHAEEVAQKMEAEWLRMEAVHTASIKFDDGERLAAVKVQIKNAHKALITLPEGAAPTLVYKMMRVYRDAVDAYWSVKVQVLHPQERQVYRQAYKARLGHFRQTERTKVVDFADYAKVHKGLDEGDGVSTVKAMRERLRAAAPPLGGLRGQGGRGHPAGVKGKGLPSKPQGPQVPSKDRPPEKCRWDEERKRWVAPWDPRWLNLPP